MYVNGIRLSDSELEAIRYAVEQTMLKVEASIEAQKFYNKSSSSPSRSDLISALDELLLDLECVHGLFFEGGEADEK